MHCGTLQYVSNKSEKAQLTLSCCFQYYGGDVEVLVMDVMVMMLVVVVVVVVMMIMVMVW